MLNATKTKPLILGIDTSCDDTSVAIVQGTKVLANAISSQIELHRKYGGVVPGLARRLHAKRIDHVITEAFSLARRNSGRAISWQEIDAVAVTFGPGLAIALEVGIAKAKTLCRQYQKPLLAVNHMEGHLLSVLAANSAGKARITLTAKELPLLGVLISGGHTELVFMQDFSRYKIIGETLDDAMGEAYDKVARMLGLGYPGGAALTELAKKGSRDAFKLPIPMARHDSLDFSYSGLKTAVFYLLKKMTADGSSPGKQVIYNLAASFEYAAITELQIKLEQALTKYRVKNIFVGGGVTGSTKVRAGIRQIAGKFRIPVYFPYSPKLYQDNGAMIAVAGYFHFLHRDFSNFNLDRDPQASLK